MTSKIPKWQFDPVVLRQTGRLELCFKSHWPRAENGSIVPPWFSNAIFSQSFCRISESAQFYDGNSGVLSSEVCKRWVLLTFKSHLSRSVLRVDFFLSSAICLVLPYCIPASSCNEQNMDQGGSNISLHLIKFVDTTWYYHILKKQTRSEILKIAIQNKMYPSYTHMDWFRGKSTGNHGSSYDKYGGFL